MFDASSSIWNWKLNSDDYAQKIPQIQHNTSMIKSWLKRLSALGETL